MAAYKRFLITDQLLTDPVLEVLMDVPKVPVESSKLR